MINSVFFSPLDPAISDDDDDDDDDMYVEKI
jgi:hypothetical protein